MGNAFGGATNSDMSSDRSDNSNNENVIETFGYGERKEKEERRKITFLKRANN